MDDPSLIVARAVVPTFVLETVPDSCAVVESPRYQAYSITPLLVVVPGVVAISQRTHCPRGTWIAPVKMLAAAAEKIWKVPDPLVAVAIFAIVVEELRISMKETAPENAGSPVGTHI